MNRTCSYQHQKGKLTSGSKEKHNSSSNKMLVSSLCKKYLSFGCRFSMDLGHNLNLIEKYEKLVRKKWRHDFSTREILPEDSPTSSQKLTFETNGKTLAPHYQMCVRYGGSYFEHLLWQWHLLSVFVDSNIKHFMFTSQVMKLIITS